MRKLKPLLALVLLALAVWWYFGQPMPAPQPATTGPAASSVQLPAFLPPEAADTLALIRSGGPYPYRQDDGVFGNRERLLPSRPNGYYREYTVVTPGARTRGARRIVTGGHPPEVYYYTDDHYRSFRRFRVRQ